MRTAVLALSILALGQPAAGAERAVRVEVRDGGCVGEGACTNPAFDRAVSQVTRPGFTLVRTGKAKSARSRSELWFRKGFQAQAEALRASLQPVIGQAAVAPWTWGGDFDLLVVVAGSAASGAGAASPAVSGPAAPMQVASTIATRMVEDQQLWTLIGLDDGSAVVMTDSTWSRLRPDGSTGFARQDKTFVGGAVPFDGGFAVATTEDEGARLTAYGPGGRERWSREVPHVGFNGLARAADGGLLVTGSLQTWRGDKRFTIDGHAMEGSHSPEAFVAWFDERGKATAARALDQYGEGCLLADDGRGNAYVMVSHASPTWSLVRSAPSGNTVLLRYEYKAFQLDLAGLAVDARGWPVLAGKVRNSDLPAFLQAAGEKSPDEPSTNDESGFVARLSPDSGKVDRLRFVGQAITATAGSGDALAVAGTFDNCTVAEGDDMTCIQQTFVAGLRDGEVAWTTRLDAALGKYVGAADRAESGDLVLFVFEDSPFLAGGSPAARVVRLR